MLLPSHSLLAARLPAHAVDQSLLLAEARWHYSTHFLAEQRGEEVLEDIACLVSGRKARNILGAQLADETRHVKLFRDALRKLGVDQRAGSYANGYAALVKQQKSLSEKVFAFQILTEAVSAAYCEWRLDAMRDDRLAAVDAEVHADEVRHLDMGRSMLVICDPDETEGVLTKARKRELLRSMNDICRRALDENLFAALVPAHLNIMPKRGASELDMLVCRSMLKEGGMSCPTRPALRSSIPATSTSASVNSMPTGT